MKKIIYKGIKYSNLVEVFAANTHSKVKNNFLKIPAAFGEGYIWSEDFEDGISFFAADICSHEDMLLERVAEEESYLILHFHEADFENENEKIISSEGIRKSAAFLSNTFLGSEILFPKHCRLRICRILFEKKHLLKIIENDVADNFISMYFSEYFRDKKIEPLNNNYRIILNELILEKIEHPFADLFIQNRIMLLIERFIKNFFQKSQNKIGIKLSEEEISRLMKVEALLIKNFDKDPPKIEVLSRLCAMSPTKLKINFKALYSMPIYEYYQKNRMMHAKNLLLENKYSTAEVGRMVGYTNLGHFAAAFKKTFNVLPKNIIKIKEQSLKRGEEIFTRS